MVEQRTKPVYQSTISASRMKEHHELSCSRTQQKKNLTKINSKLSTYNFLILNL